MLFFRNSVDIKGNWSVYAKNGILSTSQVLKQFILHVYKEKVVNFVGFYRLFCRIYVKFVYHILRYLYVYICILLVAPNHVTLQQINTKINKLHTRKV